MTSCDFVLQGYMKNVVYSQKICNVAHLKERMNEAVSLVRRDMLHRVWVEIDKMPAELPMVGTLKSIE